MTRPKGKAPKREDDRPLELRDMLTVVRRRIRLIVSMTAIAVLAAAFVTAWLVPPVYEARAEMIVSKPAGREWSALNWDTVAVNLQLMSTYRLLAGSQAVMNEVLNMKPDLPYTTRELSSLVDVEVKDGTQLITLRVRDTDHERAMEIAGLVSRAFKAKVAEIMGADHVTIISDPNPEGSREPVSPNLALNVLAAFVLSLGAGLLLAFALHFLDDTIRNEGDLADSDLPVFTVVPRIDLKDTVRRQKTKAERKAGEKAYASR